MLLALEILAFIALTIVIIVVAQTQKGLAGQVAEIVLVVIGCMGISAVIIAIAWWRGIVEIHI